MEECKTETLEALATPGCLDGVDQRVEKIGSTVLTVMFLVMTVVAIMQVISRYFLNIALSWSEELIRYLFVWTTYLGAGVATALGMHIEINIFSFVLEKKEPALREKIDRVIRTIGTAFILLFLVYYIYLVIGFLLKIRMMEQISSAMEINMLWPMSGILVGGILMLFHYIVRFLRDLKMARAQRAVKKNSTGRTN